MPIQHTCRNKPTIGLIGFGAFGRLVASNLAGYFTILASDPAFGADETSSAPGIVYSDLPEAAACPIVILAVPLGALEAAVREIAVHLRPGALVLDVTSVKIRAAQIMQDGLPDHADIVATHPLFGPQSAAAGLKGLKIALCPIRGNRHLKVAAFLRLAFGLQVYLTTPEAHDREAAMVQGLTHLIGKVVSQMGPLPHQMTTVSFDLIVEAFEMIRHDAPEVFEAIELGNPYAAEVRRKFFDIATGLDQQLNAAGGREIRMDQIAGTD